MRESSKAALGGIVSALAVVIMLITYLSPLLVYTAPPFAGILLIIIVNELGYRWAIGTYAAISLLSVFLIADKESAVMFTLFFGYYPILKTVLDRKVKFRIPRIVIKAAVFNLSMIGAVCICKFLFNIDYDDFGELGKYSLLIFALMFNVLLFFYDNLIAKLQLVYKYKLQSRFRKFFRH